MRQCGTSVKQHADRIRYIKQLCSDLDQQIADAHKLQETVQGRGESVGLRGRSAAPTRRSKGRTASARKKR